MSRRITTTQYQTALPGKQVDTYFDKVIKYIPADVLGAWVAVDGLIEGAGVNIAQNTSLWIAFVIGIFITAFWTYKQTQQHKKPAAITQIVISTGAFIVWVYASGGPFESVNLYNATYGSMLLIFYTLIVAMINPIEG
ncbi:MAG: hypothetical protein AAFV71_19930 [Cyanobacteria bacterium J06633_8]